MEKKTEIIELGTPKTIGELKEIINKYPDDLSFGFRNQPIQTLFEVKYPDQTFICFQDETIL